MTLKGQSRFFKRKDSKYLIYLDQNLGTDTSFPFPIQNPCSDLYVKVSFNDKGQLIIEEWKGKAK